MAKQIMVSDEVFEILKKLKTEFNVKSFSEVIKMLYNSLPKDEYSIINEAFEELRSKISKFFSDFEILELTRIFYLRTLGIEDNRVAKAKEKLREAYQEAYRILRKTE